MPSCLRAGQLLTQAALSAAPITVGDRNLSITPTAVIALEQGKYHLVCFQVYAFISGVLVHTGKQAAVQHHNDELAVQLAHHLHAEAQLLHTDTHCWHCHAHPPCTGPFAHG